MHEQHTIIEDEENFEVGNLAHLVIGNEGRILDGRRTPGYIESYNKESGMFIWRITSFEDKGKCWEIPAEQINSYQFRKGSDLLSAIEVEQISKQCDNFSQKLIISKSVDVFEYTQKIIEENELLATDWIKQKSKFYKKQMCLELNSKVGDMDLFCDVEEYLKDVGVLELEHKTAEQYLLNPYSGEWIKGMKITMAEMGLIDYSGTIPRTKNIFSGIGEKCLREKYIIARSAYVRTIFKLSGYCEVPLYRGMSSDIDFFETPSTLISATFSSDTAKEFASIDSKSNSRSCYYVKFTYPVDNLFMTFLETKQFNERYKEQEAIIYYKKNLSFKHYQCGSVESF